MTKFGNFHAVGTKYALAHNRLGLTCKQDSNVNLNLIALGKSAHEC